MANTYWEGVATGTQSIYTVPFPFINIVDVGVYLNGIQRNTPADYQWLSPSSIQFNGNVLAGSVVRIQRSTSPNSLDVSFSNGAILTADDLNIATRQNFYRTQELQDQLDSYISGAMAVFNQGVTGTQTAQQMIDAVAQGVLSSSLYSTLSSQITDVATQAQSIIDQATQLTSLTATVNSLTSVGGTGISTYITNETTARIAGDTALASTIALIGAANAGNTAFVLDLSTVNVDPVTSLATRLAGIDSAHAANLASINSEASARATADTALSTSISSLTSTVNTNNSAATASLASEATTRATADTANAAAISSLTATVTGNNTTLTAAAASEQSARVSGDAANASSISVVQAIAISKNVTFAQAAVPVANAIGDLWLDTGNGNVIKRWNGTAWVVLQDSGITVNSAAIATEQTARANGDSANAALISALSATVSSNLTTTNASIVNEASVRATADTANATSISSLATTVAGNTASISSQATSIGGLSAQYTVKVDVNGHVAGFGLASTPINGTPFSSFIINANEFSVVDPGNGLTAPIVPFAVVGGVVYMSNVVIGDALISNLTLTKLTSGTLNADMSLGTGKIIWDNGVYMKVTGVGFGTSNQFLEWFGPHQASYTTCSEANAVSYLKTSGSAYFGGTLLAGKLTNAVQSTVLTTANLCDLGPFSSNGNQITMTWSYSFDGSTTYNYGTSVTVQNPSAQLVLSRSLNGAAFVDVLTISINNGSYSNTAPVQGLSAGLYAQTMGGSGTFVDPSLLAQPREYKLRIASWTNVNTNVSTNTLSLQSVE